MGAYFDTTKGAGKTMGEAFNAVVDHARWEHGHGGYTGTMAEKPGATLIELPKGMTAKRFELLVLEASEHDGEAAVEIRERLRYGNLTATQKRRIEAEARKQERADARFWKKIPAHAHAAVRQASRIVEDKWGPACAVELRGAEAREFKTRHACKRGTRVFLFFGYCSS